MLVAAELSRPCSASASWNLEVVLPGPVKVDLTLQVAAPPFADMATNFWVAVHSRSWCLTRPPSPFYQIICSGHPGAEQRSAEAGEPTAALQTRLACCPEQKQTTNVPGQAEVWQTFPSALLRWVPRKWLQLLGSSPDLFVAARTPKVEV